MISKLCVCGTDTEVGKSVITGLLCRYFSLKGLNTVTQKWIQTGTEKRDESDIVIHNSYLETRRFPPYPAAQCPYCFPLAASPHLAARQAGIAIEPAIIRTELDMLSQSHDMVIAEGTGGVLVPVSNHMLFIDLLSEFSMPVVLVVKKTLGCINQALLTVEALRARNIQCIGIILNEPKTDQTMPKIAASDLAGVIEEFSQITVLGTLPFSKSRADLFRLFEPIGNRLWTRLLT